MRQLIITFAILCFVTISAAGDQPTTKAGRLALERYSAAKAKLDADYQTRLTAIKRTLAAELEVAKRSATRSGDLVDANAIQAIIDEIIGVTQTFRIDAAKEWQPTITVKKGQTISIEAEASWTGGPGTPEPFDADGLLWQGHRTFQLQAKVGDGPVVTVGKRVQFVAQDDGVLSLQMDDTLHADNTGAAKVSVSSR